MRAVQIDHHGGPEVLQLREVPDATLELNGVLIRVIASSINPVDWKTRAWDRGPALPMTLGWDLAGVVVASDEPAFEPGDRVVAMSAQIATGLGTWSDLVCVPGHLVAPAPASVSLTDAAALPLAVMTARTALDALGPEPHERMLVLGGAGGVGSLVVQLARIAGLHVDALVSRETHVQRVRGLGVDNVFCDVGEIPRHVYDIVLDTAGTAAEVALAEGGRYAWITDEPPPHVPGPLNPQVGEDGEMLRRMMTLVDAFSITPGVVAYQAITEVRAAHERFEAGGLGGKLVLQF